MLSICSRIRRSSSARSFSTLGPSMNHTVGAERSSTGRFVPTGWLQQAAELAHIPSSAFTMVGAKPSSRKTKTKLVARVRISRSRLTHEMLGGDDPARIFPCKLIGGWTRDNTAKAVPSGGDGETDEPPTHDMDYFRTDDGPEILLGQGIESRDDGAHLARRFGCPGGRSRCAIRSWFMRSLAAKIWTAARSI
jgi:hypothetical protein